MKTTIAAFVAAIGLAGSVQAETFNINFEGMSPGIVDFMLNDWISVHARLVDADPAFAGSGLIAADYIGFTSIDQRRFYLDSFDVYRPGDTTDPLTFYVGTLYNQHPGIPVTIDALNSQQNITFADTSLQAIVYTPDPWGGQYDNLVIRTDEGSVPEPATWAMMIAGFGMAGAALRRRRAVAA